MRKFINLFRIMIIIFLNPSLFSQTILTEPDATLGELIIKVLNPPSGYALDVSINLVGMGFSGSVSQPKIYSLEYSLPGGYSQPITGGEHTINGYPGTWAIEHVEDGHPDGGETWIGYGLYEIRVRDELIYLDYLDSEYPYGGLNPDIYIEYDFNRPEGSRIDVSHSSPYYKVYPKYGDVLKVWEIFGQGNDPIATNFYIQSTVPISANQLEEKLFTNVIVDQNVIVPSGKIFTINRNEYPQPTILGKVGMCFNGAGSMTVNGTMNAIGFPSNEITFDRNGNSGSWGGIVFNSGSSGSVEYCNISHAATGITCNTTLPMIRYNTIANNTTGISVSNVGTVSNEISYNTIQSNTYQGISLYTASPKIYSNTISGNAYYGISCNYYSSPYIYGNTITGHTSSALSCYYYSSARLVPWNAYGYYWGAGRNKIKNNTGDGIIASYWSNLYLGNSPYGGYNSICTNTGYELRAYYGCTVTAQLNWWGAYPPNVNEFYPYQSTIDYSNARQTDPNPDNQSIVRGPTGISNSSTINSAKSDLDKAYGLQLEGKFDEAIAVYDSYINADPIDSKSAYALVRIDECYKLSGKEGAANYLDNTIKNKANKNSELDAVSLELKNQYLIQDKKYEEAVNNLNKLAAAYKTNKDVEKYSLFNAGYVYLTYLHDYKNASTKFAELAAKYPDDELVSVSEYLLGNLNANNQQKLASPNISQSDLPVPTDYALDQNYPNPFNPATTITYQLPKSGSVTLKIFDILGKEVKTLVNEQKEMGRYTVQFSAAGGASSLSSGMYVYQLRANGYTSTKKMMLVK